MPSYPDPGAFGSLLDLLDDAATRYGSKPGLSMRTDRGIELAWGPAEIRRRARLAAWRLRVAGLQRGDRLLTWSPATPQLPAVYWAAMYVGAIVVPLDLRMAPAVLQRIADRAGTRFLVIGTGADGPDPVAAGLADLRLLSLETLTAEATGDADFPPGWESQLDAWPRPTRGDLFETVFTSGTTSYPKGVMLTHGNILETLRICRVLLPPRPHRAVALLPLSHLFEQAPVLFYGTMIGADVLYVRSRNPRVVFEALREHRVTTMVVTPQLLEIFWNGLGREIDRQGRRRTFERARRIARHLPYVLRRRLFASIHRQLGGQLRLFVCAGAYLPPDLQMGWEDLGVIVLQGYGATEVGPAAANSERDHPTGTVGRTIPPVRLRLAEADHEILLRGPTMSPGYWQDPEATAEAFDADGWYHTGDIGLFDQHGRLVLTGRKKNIIVLPSGLNVYPEDVEAALQDHGLSQSVVVETTPGRIEAIVLPPGAQPVLTAGQASPDPPDAERLDEIHAQVDAIVKAANAQLGIHQRIDAWRLWPEPDFPRTHTLKIRRDAVREWAAGDAPLPVREEVPVAG